MPLMEHLESNFFNQLQKEISHATEDTQRLCICISRDEIKAFINDLPHVLTMIANKTNKHFAPLSLCELSFKTWDSQQLLVMLGWDYSEADIVSIVYDFVFRTIKVSDTNTAQELTKEFNQLSQTEELVPLGGFMQDGNLHCLFKRRQFNDSQIQVTEINYNSADPDCDQLFFKEVKKEFFYGYFELLCDIKAGQRHMLVTIENEDAKYCVADPN